MFFITTFISLYVSIYSFKTLIHPDLTKEGNSGTSHYTDGRGQVSETVEKESVVGKSKDQWMDSGIIGYSVQVKCVKNVIYVYIYCMCIYMYTSQYRFM